MQWFVIESKQALIKQWNGQRCSYDPTKSAIGASGETKLYSLGVGCGLYLRDDEVKSVPGAV